MARNRFPHIYEPIRVGSMTMKNRIQFSPIVSNHADVETGRVGHELLEFVSMQAQTGCGLVTIGSTPINFAEGRDFYSCLSATSDLDIPGLGLLAEEVHRYDCNLSAELIHAGQWAALNGKEAWVPSVVEKYHKAPRRYHEITRSEMLSVIDDYMAAARRCMEAGFDLIRTAGASPWRCWRRCTPSPRGKYPLKCGWWGMSASPAARTSPSASPF